MSQAIDERIVSMEFDNERFEKNIGQTMKSLDNLDEHINDMSRGVSESFSSTSKSFFDLEQIITGFNYRVGGYIADLTKSFLSFGKSMTFDQAKAGFDKYTAETLSAQTIVSNAGKQIAETYDLINEAGEMDEAAVIKETYKAIEKLAKYTDETSYSYESLVDTMSKFVMNGTDLYDAEQAMEGIGNWAAVTGAGIQKASAVMPTLVKAVNAGYLRLRDWQSIQANNMADPEFVERLLQHARETNAELVKFEKKNGKITFATFTDEKNGVFGNNKFITSEALIATLQEYGNALEGIGKKGKAAASEAKTLDEAIGAVKDAVSSGWSLSYRYLFGDYSEARKFFTMIQDAMLDVFTIGTEYRNEVLRIWHSAEEGGYNDLLEGMQNFWDGIKGLVKPIGDAFHEIFGFENAEETAKSLTAITKRFKDFAVNFNTFISAPEKLRARIDEISKGVFEGLSLEEILDSTTISFKNKHLAYQLFDDLYGGEVGAARSILEDLYKTFTGGFSVFKIGTEFVSGFKTVIGQVLESLSQLVRPILGLSGAVGGFITKLSDAIRESKVIRKVFNAVATVIKGILSPAIEIVNGVITAISKKLKNTDSFDEFKNVLEKIGDAAERIGEAISDKIHDAFEWLKSAAEKVATKLAPLKKILDDIGERISGSVSKIFAPQTVAKATLFDSVADAIEKIAEWLLNKAVLPLLDNFVSLITDLWDAAQPLGPVLGTVADSIGKIFSSLFSSKGEEDSSTSALGTLFGVITDIATFLMENAVVPLIQSLADVLKDLGDKASPLGSIFDSIKTGVSNFFKALFGLGEGGNEAKEKSEALANIGNFLKDAGEIIGKVAGWFGGILHGIYENIKDNIDKLKGLSFSEIINGILDILKVVKGIFAAKTVYNLSTFTGNLSGITGAIKDFISGLGDAKKSSSLILDVGKSLLMIAAACLIVASIPAAQLNESAKVIHDFIASLVGSVIAMNTTSSYFTGVKAGINITQGFASNLVDLAAAILIIALALKSLAKENFTPEQIKMPLEAIESLIFELALVEVALGKFGGKGKPKGLLTFALVIYIFGKILKDLAKNVDADALWEASKALALIIGVTGAIIVALSALSKKLGTGAKLTVNMNTSLMQLALVIVALGALMFVLSKYVVGDDSLVTAVACLGGVVLALIALTEVAKHMDATAKNILEMYAFIGALAALAGVLKILSGLNIGSMIGGLLGITALMIQMVALAGVASSFSASFTEMAAGLLAMYAVVGLMAAMAGVLTMLSNLDVKNAAIGLLELVGAFVVLTGIAVTATILEPFLVTLNGLFTGFAIGLALASAAALGFALAFKIIVDTLNDGVPKIQARGESVSAGLITVLDTMIEAVSAFVPKLIELVVSILVGIIRQIAESAEEIVSSIILLIKNVGESIDRHSEEIGEAVARLLVGILKAVWSFLKNLLFDLLGWFGVSREEAGNFFSNIWEKITTFVSDTWNKITGFFVDIWNSISEWFTTAINDVGTFFADIWKSIVDWFNGLIESVVGWFEDIKKKVSSAWNAVLDFFNPKRKENKDAVADATTVGKNIAEGAAKGISGNSATAENESKKMMGRVIFKASEEAEINSPSRVMARIGRFLDEGLANGISNFAYLAGDAAGDLADNAIDPMHEAIEAISDFDSSIVSDPTIRPVLDLTDIQNGAKNIGSMFGNYQLGASLAGVSGALRNENTQAGYGAPIINMTINAAEGQDVEELANIIQHKINASLRSRNAVWA